MYRKLSVLLSGLLFTITALSQTSFSYSPQHPKPGDRITFTYVPSGDIASTLKPVEAGYYLLGYAESGPKNIAADNIMLKREGNKYTGSVQTDTGSHFIYFGFSSDKKFDNNFNQGYYILLEDAGKPKRGAHVAQAFYYSYYGGSVGVEASQEKAFDALKRELELYPEDKRNYVGQYYRLMNSVKKEETAAAIQADIERTMKAGLKTESDYAMVEALYAAAKLPEQAKMMAALKKEKFPTGKWTVNDFYNKYYAEKDAEKAAAMLDDAIAKSKTDPAWNSLESNLDNLKMQPLYAHFRAKDWAAFEKMADAVQVKDYSVLANIYNEAAWEMQKTSTDLERAEKFSRIATLWAKAQIEKPTGEKPPYYTTRDWEVNRKFAYKQYGDTYAMVLYRKGDYKNGYKYAKEILKMSEGKNPGYNNTYALNAEKALPVKQYQKELESFIKNGNAGDEVKGVLKRAYMTRNGSEEGFEAYITALEKESYLKMMEELRKSMLKETAPGFALLDLDGNTINIADLRGKVVVVDFWATWCGPCIASFPGMQNMVSKYKDDPNVKFVFIDTWENVEDKKNNAADFISSNKYTFQVLMDTDNKVVEQFKVEGIPTKFVIDKNGIIRFKSVGYNGSDDKLVLELTAMIDLASQQTADTKSF